MTKETAIRLLGAVLDDAKHRTKLKGRTGAYVGGAVERNPTNGAPRNHINVRIGATLDDPAGRSTIAVWNVGPKRVTTTFTDVPVEIDYNADGELQVVDCPANMLDESLGNAVGAADADPPPMEVNRSILSVKNLFDLRPRVDTANGGLYLWIEKGWYDGGYWIGGRVNLADQQTVTSGAKAWVVAALDRVTGSILMAAGADTALPVPTETQYDEIINVLSDNVFDDAVPIAAVMLRWDATGYTNNEIVDLRLLFNGRDSESGIQSIQPGTGINVDDTDPANPILSATGGGGGHEIRVNDTPAPNARPALNFKNTAGFTFSLNDDAVDGETEITGVVNVAGLTLKSVPHYNDEIMIADSENANALKKISISALALTGSAIVPPALKVIMHDNFV